MKPYKWEPLEDANDDDGTHTCWSALINHYKYGRWAYIEGYGENGNEYEIFTEHYPDHPIMVCKSLASAKRWVTQNIKKKYEPKTKEELKELCDDPDVCLGDIDTSNITDMSHLFDCSQREDFFGIETWDTSNVISMQYMFYNAKFFDYPIGDWNVSNVRNMDYMFCCAGFFNRPVGNWNIANVKDMEDMFAGAVSFKQDLPEEWAKKAGYKNPSVKKKKDIVSVR